MIDGIACEPQFIDHLAPVWRSLSPAARGRLYVPERLLARARERGLVAEPIDDMMLRRSSQPPKARPGRGPIAFVVSIGDTKVARRMGYRRFAFMEHGAGQSYLGANGLPHPSYAGGADREDTDLFLVPNDYCARTWRRAYPRARIEVVGNPRLEALPRRGAGPSPVVGISFHWPAFVSPESGTALGEYLPLLPDIGAAFSVIGHAHPKGDWPRRMERYYRRAGIEFVADFDDVLRRADVYVCDNSSSIFEFAATGRPVVLLNSRSWRRDVHHGGRFWDWASIGVNVDRPGALLDGVAEGLHDTEERRVERERVLGLVYRHRTGAALLASAVLEQWLSGVEAA